MNQPNFPLGSLTAEDARWVRQDNALPAPRRADTIDNGPALEALRQSVIGARRAALREAVRIVIGGIAGAVLFLVGLPILLRWLGA